MSQDIIGAKSEKYENICCSSMLYLQYKLNIFSIYPMRVKIYDTKNIFLF